MTITLQHWRTMGLIFCKPVYLGSLGVSSQGREQHHKYCNESLGTSGTVMHPGYGHMPHGETHESVLDQLHGRSGYHS